MTMTMLVQFFLKTTVTVLLSSLTIKSLQMMLKFYIRQDLSVVFSSWDLLAPELTERCRISETDPSCSWDLSVKLRSSF